MRKSSEMGGEDRREGKSVSGERGREEDRCDGERERGGQISSSLLAMENFRRERRVESTRE